MIVTCLFQGLPQRWQLLYKLIQPPRVHKIGLGLYMCLCVDV